MLLVTEARPFRHPSHPLGGGGPCCWGMGLCGPPRRESRGGADWLAAAAQFRDLVMTPLGLLGEILGVKYEDPEKKEGGRIWARYDDGREAPMEAMLVGVATMGYRRAEEHQFIERARRECGSKYEAIWQAMEIPEEEELRLEVLDLEGQLRRPHAPARSPGRPQTAGMSRASSRSLLGAL